LIHFYKRLKTVSVLGDHFVDCQKVPLPVIVKYV